MYFNSKVLCCSEAAAHAVATLAEATLQGGGQIVLAETAAAVGALAGVQDATGNYSCHILYCMHVFIRTANTKATCKCTLNSIIYIRIYDIVRTERRSSFSIIAE